MSSLPTPDQSALPMLDALERVLPEWHRTDAFERAVAETVARAGYAAVDVERQLRHVALRCRGRTMRHVLGEEIVGGLAARRSDAPANVLVLASGRIPGLAIEGIAAAAAIDADVLIRPSSDETVLHHFLGTIRASEPALMQRIEVVGTDGEIPWDRVRSALVFGSDATIAMVRDRLDADAAARIAGYGSRQGIAIALPGADVDPSWAERLADDVLAFRQSGCMCPAWLILVGRDDAQLDRLQERVGRELIMASERHVAPGVESGMVQRRASDADVLGAIAAGMAPSSSELYAGDARLTVVRVHDLDAMAAQVRQLDSLQQTAVVATDHAQRAEVATMLLNETGITRVCLPGQAHEPDPLWPQDGIGRIAPLLGGP